MADTGERPTEVTSRYEPSQEDLRVLPGIGRRRGVKSMFLVF